MKIDRLYSIALFLSARESATVAELAERFEVSVRTIHRDLEALDLAGVPVVTRQGRGGGVGLMPGYRLEGGYLTRRELRELAVTLEGIAPILSGTRVPTIVGKMAALGEGGGTDVPPVDIDLTGWRRRPGWQEVMTALVEAIKSERTVRFRYTSLKDIRTMREVEPLKVIFSSSNWYLSGWCRLRRDYRWFTVSRIEEIRILSSRFDRRRRLEEMRGDDGFGDPVADIRLSLTAKGLAKARDYIDPDSIDPPNAGGGDSVVRFTATMRWPANEWVYGFLLSLGPEASVLEPGEVRREMERRIARMAEGYASAD